MFLNPFVDTGAHIQRKKNCSRSQVAGLHYKIPGCCRYLYENVSICRESSDSDQLELTGVWKLSASSTLLYKHFTRLLYGYKNITLPVAIVNKQRNKITSITNSITLTRLSKCHIFRVYGFSVWCWFFQSLNHSDIPILRKVTNKKK